MGWAEKLFLGIGAAALIGALAATLISGAEGLAGSAGRPGG
jgi:hypothetical protein